MIEFRLNGYQEPKEVVDYVLFNIQHYVKQKVIMGSSESSNCIAIQTISKVAKACFIRDYITSDDENLICVASNDECFIVGSSYKDV